MKRVFDFSIALFLLFLMLPIMLIIALLVRIMIGSPVLFKQERPGIRSKPFYLFKFRTMTEEKDAYGQLLPDDQRLTSLGKFLRKFSLDEIPQLLNVVKGEMSFVGPRPLLMEYLPLYSAEQVRRHEVKPGITGWAQVNGRNAISWGEKFALDVWYVDHRSFWLDLKILWRTLLKVVNAEGINQSGQVTMDRFRGLGQ